MAQWNLAAKGRNDFADMVEPLTDEQWQQRSLCEAWTAHGVLAHLTSFVETGIFSFFGHMVKNRFDFDKVSVSMTDERSERSAADLIASLRANAAKSSPLPMFPERLTVSDTAIHTQDVPTSTGSPGIVGRQGTTHRAGVRHHRQDGNDAGQPQADRGGEPAGDRPRLEFRRRARDLRSGRGHPHGSGRSAGARRAVRGRARPLAMTVAVSPRRSRPDPR